MKVEGTFNLSSCVFSARPSDAYITKRVKY
jgi:hypothetical protein